jgi:hypothetical protein
MCISLLGLQEVYGAMPLGLHVVRAWALICNGGGVPVCRAMLVNTKIKDGNTTKTNDKIQTHLPILPRFTNMLYRFFTDCSPNPRRVFTTSPLVLRTFADSSPVRRRVFPASSPLLR